MVPIDAILPVLLLVTVYGTIYSMKCYQQVVLVINMSNLWILWLLFYLYHKIGKIHKINTMNDFDVLIKKLILNLNGM